MNFADGSVKHKILTQVCRPDEIESTVMLAIIIRVADENISAKF